MKRAQQILELLVSTCGNVSLKGTVARDFFHPKTSKNCVLSGSKCVQIFTKFAVRWRGFVFCVSVTEIIEREKMSSLHSLAK